MLRRTAMLASIGCILATGAFAQSTPVPTIPTRLRGTAAAVTTDMLTVATRDGPQVQVTLNQPVTVTALKPMSIDEIQPGSSLAIVSKPGTDDLEALSVIYFPPGAPLRQGQFPWDLPNTTMTNASVSGNVTGKSGREIDLSFNGRSGKVTIPPGTPLVTQIPASLTDIKPGVTVFLFATKGDDGTFSTARVTVGKDGVNPAS